MSTVVIDAEIAGCGGLAVRIEDGRVIALDATARIDRRGAEVIDAAGGALIPGLHDHHVHLLALAARSTSVDLADVSAAVGVDDRLRVAVRGSRGDGAGWLRATGYDEHRHGAMDRHRLDAVCGGVPVRVQHRSGLSWVVSSTGLVELGLEVAAGGGTGGDPPSDERVGFATAGRAEPGVERDADGSATGWLHRLDDWMAPRVGRVAPDLTSIGCLLAGFGITGVTDTTPVLDDGALEALVRARSAGALPQRLMVMGRADADGLGQWAALGPVKLVADEHRGLDPIGMGGAIEAAHADGRAVAIHCVTRAECVSAVSALEAAGARPGDRLEHASVLPRDLDGYLAAAAVTVVTQPSFVAERGDHYLAAVDPVDRADLYRLASLRRAGVAVALGSDAPVASVDPWAAIGSAQRRETRDGRVLGADERVAASVALAGFLGAAGDPGGPSRSVVPGVAADLCLLHDPLAPALVEPGADRVRCTMIAGEIVHAR